MSFESNNGAANRTRYGTLFLQGTVINNNDPLGLDRIQVKIPEFYDPDKGEVPWCLPVKSSPFGQGSSWGTFGVPAIGSTVCIELQQNNPEFPIYHGYLHTVKQEPFGNPNVWGYKDPSGTSLLVDTKENVLEFVHSSGVGITISASGDVTIEDVAQATLRCGTAVIKASSLKVDCPTNEFTGVVKAPTINASNSLTVAGIEMKSHVHGGVDRGNSSTNGPQ